MLESVMSVIDTVDSSFTMSLVRNSVVTVGEDVSWMNLMVLVVLLVPSFMWVSDDVTRLMISVGMDFMVLTGMLEAIIMRLMVGRLMMTWSKTGHFSVSLMGIWVDKVKVFMWLISLLAMMLTDEVLFTVLVPHSCHVFVNTIENLSNSLFESFRWALLVHFVVHRCRGRMGCTVVNSVVAVHKVVSVLVVNWSGVSVWSWLELVMIIKVFIIDVSVPVKLGLSVIMGK